jgi:hypothetical protein
MGLYNNAQIDQVRKELYTIHHPPMMIYTNLWLPKRFNLLNIYVGALLISFVIIYFKRRKSKPSFSCSLTKYTKLV